MEQMKSLEESIAAAMDAQQDMAVIPFLPYILQDFWELGTPSEIVINLIRKHCIAETHTSLRILDLGCGKGAVSVKLAAALKCNCCGIDAIPEFITSAKEKAREYGVDTLCRFEVGDVRVEIDQLDKFDAIILGATGSIFGDYGKALKTLSQHLTNEGIIIIEEAYIDDMSDFQHPPLVTRSELLRQFGQSGMELIDETTGNYSDFADSAAEMENIEKRCNELKAKYPEKSSLFQNYAQNQASEYDILENKVSGAIMVLKSVKT
jgi:ubiquinone/menaquinone biosynthesis C-methylase UbiE